MNLTFHKTHVLRFFQQQPRPDSSAAQTCSLAKLKMLESSNRVDRHYGLLNRISFAISVNPLLSISQEGQDSVKWVRTSSHKAGSGREKRGGADASLYQELGLCGLMSICSQSHIQPDSQPLQYWAEQVCAAYRQLCAACLLRQKCIDCHQSPAQ